MAIAITEIINIANIFKPPMTALPAVSFDHFVICEFITSRASGDNRCPFQNKPPLS